MFCRYMVQVLTLTGSARLLQSRWTILSELDGFMEAWSTFLGIVRECAFSNTSEVSGCGFRWVFILWVPLNFKLLHVIYPCTCTCMHGFSQH